VPGGGGGGCRPGRSRCGGRPPAGGAGRRPSGGLESGGGQRPPPREWPLVESSGVKFYPLFARCAGEVQTNRHGNRPCVCDPTNTVRLDEREQLGDVLRWNLLEVVRNGRDAVGNALALLPYVGPQPHMKYISSLDGVNPGIKHWGDDGALLHTPRTSKGNGIHPSKTPTPAKWKGNQRRKVPTWGKPRRNAMH